MANIAADPFYLQNATLKLGDDNYEATVSSATLTPSSSSSVWRAINGDAHTLASKASWTLDLTFAQDHETVKSLSLYAFDHELEEIAFEVRPKGTGHSGYQGVCILTPGAIGGPSDGTLEASASFPVLGKPTRVAAA